MAIDEKTLAAEGWDRLLPLSYSGSIGPVWTKDSNAGAQVGFIASENTANENIGIVHGGAMLTFADVALGYAVTHALGNADCATAQLQHQFVGAARIGDFVICDTEIVRKTSQLVFVRGLMHVGDRAVGAADAIFKVLEPAKMMRLKGG